MADVREIINPLRHVRGTFYGWWLVGAATTVMIMASVPLFYGLTAWFPVLETRFQWSRAQLSLAFSLSRVEGSVTGPLGGYLTDKLGPRRMVLIGLLCLGGGFVLMGQIQNLWQFYLAFIIVSTGAGLGTWLPMMTVLNNWFLRKRATAMSRAMAGSAAGGILLVPLLAWSIDPEHFGIDRWRAVSTGVGAVIMFFALPISLVIRNRPEDYGQYPDGIQRSQASATPEGTGTSQPASDAPGLTWQEALRTRTFWLMTIGHACSSAVIVTISVHLGSMLNLDRGLPLQTVGLVVSTYLGVGALFNLVGGYIGDRLPIRMAIFGFSALQSVALGVLLLTNSTPLAFLFGVLLGISFGGRSPLTTAIRGIYFGRRAFASIMGMSMVPMNGFMIALPLFAGYMFDTTGSYNIPFMVLIVLNLVGSCLFLMLGEPRLMSAAPKTARQSGT